MAEGRPVKLPFLTEVLRSRINKRRTSSVKDNLSKQMLYAHDINTIYMYIGIIMYVVLYQVFCTKYSICKNLLAR